MASTVIQLVLGVILAFVPWLQLYLVLKFFLGLISVSIVFTGFVLCEYFPTNFKSSFLGVEAGKNFLKFFSQKV